MLGISSSTYESEQPTV